MKRLSKCLIGIIILTTITLSVQAQFNWGLKMGVNGSTQSDLGNIYMNNEITTNYNFGLMAYYDLNDWISINSGLSYEGKGRKIEEDNSANTVTTNLQYLKLPVKTEFSAGEKAGFKNGQEVFAATGPYFGYLVNAKTGYTGKSQSVDNTFENTDFGWSFEVGMKFPVTQKNNLHFSVNYDLGMAQISTSNKDLRNKTASLNLGLRF
ncbi:MAG TPA: porin family protein [Draconibacterium sp.]|nr:porin family protein [Draconibacterium sp.]